MRSGMLSFGEDGGEIGNRQRLPEQDAAIAALAVQCVETIEDPEDESSSHDQGGDIRAGDCRGVLLRPVPDAAYVVPQANQLIRSRRAIRRRQSGARDRSNGSPRIRAGPTSTSAARRDSRGRDALRAERRLVAWHSMGIHAAAPWAPAAWCPSRRRTGPRCSACALRRARRVAAVGAIKQQDAAAEHLALVIGLRARARCQLARDSPSLPLARVDLFHAALEHDAAASMNIRSVRTSWISSTWCVVTTMVVAVEVVVQQRS